MLNKKFRNGLIAFALAAFAGAVIAAAPAPTTTTIVISPSTVSAGDLANATGQTKITSSGATVAIGKLELQSAQDGALLPTSCSGQTNFASGTPTNVDGTGSATFSLNTNAVGTFGYRTHYTQGSTYGTSKSPCVDLTVSAVDCSGVNISADLATGNGTPEAGIPQTWTVRMKVHACDDATGLKVQGGTNGWATNTVLSASPGSYSIKNNKKNQVITWNMDSLNAGQDADLVLQIDGTIKAGTPSGTVLGLTGPWSVVYSTDGGVTSQKSEYTGTVTVTVQ